jgi:PAS domain S-box-containing protein
VLVYTEDITARKQAEEALRASEEHYRSLFERSLDAVLLTSPDGKILAANPAACQIFGRTEEEICQIGREGIVDPTDPRLPQMLAERARTGQMRGELIHVRKNGEKFPAEIACKVFMDKNGERKTCMIVRDVTERKRAEETLRQSEANLRAIFDSSLGSFLLIDRNKNLLAFNKTAGIGAKRVFGCELQEGASIYQIIRPESRDRFDHHFQMALQGNPIKVESHLKGVDQTDTWLEVTYTPVANKGEVLGVCISMLNVTEHKRLEENLRASEKLAATGRMAARIAHEISNPLAGIKNAFLLIKRSLPADHPHYEFADLIEEEINRIARIVRQMYDLYRPEQEVAHPFMIDKVVYDIIMLVQHQCRERGVTIAEELLQPSPALVLPESSVRQVLLNLLINAIEASPRGGVVGVRTRLDGERLRIEVLDQGSGIPEAIQSQIFEPFFTTKGASATGGLGLGLSVSKSVAEAMGGILDFANLPEGGAVFQLTVPCNVEKPGTEKKAP